VVFELPRVPNNEEVGYPGTRVDAKIDPSGNVMSETERLLVATEVAIGSAIVFDGVTIEGAVFKLPLSKVLVPNRIEIIAVAMTRDVDCCGALEVDTTTGSVDVEDAAGPVLLTTVGDCSGGEDAVDDASSVPGVMIIACWAVTAVLTVMSAMEVLSTTCWLNSQGLYGNLLHGQRRCRRWCHIGAPGTFSNRGTVELLRNSRNAV
jgi:hypothetical protein